MARILQIKGAQITALEQTAEALHTEVVQAQIMPRDTGVMQGESTFIKAGTESISTYEDGTEVVNSISKAENGKVTIATAAPQVRRLYFHPEYHFKKHENPNAKGEWYEDYVPGGKYDDFAQKAFKELYRRIAGL